MKLERRVVLIRINCSSEVGTKITLKPDMTEMSTVFQKQLCDF